MNRRATIERYCHWLAALTVGVGHLAAFPTLYPARPDDLIGTVVNISGIAVGFLSTGQALLCSLTDNFVVATLRKHGRFEDMLRFFSVAIHWCLWLAVYSLASHWVDFGQHRWLFSIWAGSFAGSAVATIRILSLFNRVLHVRPQG